MEDFGENALLTDLTLYIQLKATTKERNEQHGKIPYYLEGIKRYNKLRKETIGTPLILVVLFLPKDENAWLTWSQEHLLLQRCAWWVSLRGAPETPNQAGVTVYLPAAQAFGPPELKAIMSRLAREEELRYDG